MSPEELQLLIAGYVLSDLDPEEAAAFEQLLAANPAIAEDVAQMQNALEVSYASPEVIPPAHLRADILNQISSMAAETARRPASTRPFHRRSFSWRSLVEVAAAGLVVALGVNNYRLSQALQTAQSQTMPQYATTTYVLDATQGDSVASAVVTVDPNNLEATLTAENLPPLPPGQVYVLWTVLQQDAPFTVDEKAAILTGVFQVDSQGSASKTIAVPPVYRVGGVVSRVAVTIEDANAPQRHAGSPIMVTDL